MDRLHSPMQNKDDLIGLMTDEMIQKQLDKQWSEVTQINRLVGFTCYTWKPSRLHFDASGSYCCVCLVIYNISGVAYVAILFHASYKGSQ